MQSSTKLPVILIMAMGLLASAAQTPTPGQIMAGVRPRGACKEVYALIAPSAGGKSIYVSTSGNDANSGTAQSPMATITEASKKANSGDVINVASGTYNGAVTIHANGSEAKPVVVQAEECGKVILTSGGNQRVQAADWRGGDGNSVSQTQNLWITLRGLVIRQMFTQAGPTNQGTNGDPYAAMRISNGWKVSNCSFDRNTVGMDIRADNIVIEKSEFRNSGHLSILGAGNGDADPGSGWVFRDLIIQGSNQNLHQIAHEASHKLLLTTGILVDNVESYGNHGPGWWFDWHNSDFIVRNSYFHDNISDQEYWTGMAVMSEVNDGGLIEDNVFHDNEGAAVGLLESRNMEIRRNLFVNDIIEIRCMAGRGMDIGNINIHHNQFKNSGASRWGQDNESCRGQHPREYMTFDYNSYNGNYAYRWLWFGADVDGLSGMKSLGWEANGAQTTIDWPIAMDSSLWGNGYQPPPQDTSPQLIPASGIIEAESADQLNGLDVKPGVGLGFSNGGDWAVFKNLLFTTEYQAVSIAYGTLADYAGQAIELRLDSPTGALIASVTTQGTGDWTSFQDVSTNLLVTPSGRHDLYLVMVDKGSLAGDWVADVDRITFQQNSVTPIYRSDASKMQVYQGARGVTLHKGKVAIHTQHGNFHLNGMRILE